MSIRETLEARVAVIAERNIKSPAKQQIAQSKKAEVIQLPLWPEPVRAVPNGILRSAVFGVVAKGRRRYVSKMPVPLDINADDDVREKLDHELMPSVDGMTIHYTGPRLDQGDLDVWLAILHAVRTQSLGAECRVSSYMLLKLMDKPDSGKNRLTLTKRIVRLRAGTLHLRLAGVGEYIGGFVRGAYKDEETQGWVIELDPKIYPLFAQDQYTLLGYETRLALGRQPLAQWLHGFYSSHARPFPMRVETILRLTGSENSSQTSAKQKLCKALDAVTQASTAHGESFGYEIVGDLVHVKRGPSGSQGRHLVRKIFEKKQKQKPR